MFQEEPPQGSDCDSLVGERAMKEDGSPVESVPRHKFQVRLASQPVDVFFIDFVDEFLIRNFLDWHDSLPADMLDRVVGDV